MQNEIDFTFGKWLKWSEVELVHRAVNVCSLSVRARIWDNTLNGSYTELCSCCNQTLVEIFSSNLDYKWSILTSLRISGTIERTRLRFQPAKWQSTARKQPRFKVKLICIAQHIWWYCNASTTSAADRFAPWSHQKFKQKMTKLYVKVGLGGGGSLGKLNGFGLKFWKTSGTERVIFIAWGERGAERKFFLLGERGVRMGFRGNRGGISYLSQS